MNPNRMPDQDRYTDERGMCLPGVEVADLLIAWQRFIAEWWGRPQFFEAES